MSLKLRSALVLVIGTVLGLTVSIGSSMLADHEQKSPEPAAEPSFEDAAAILLTEALNRVRREYVNEVDERTLVEDAIKGMLGGLDQHSRYLDNEQYEDIRIATTGNYTGVGLDIKLTDGKVTVIEPLADAPAAKAGILAGDVVVSVDDVPIADDDIEAAISRMRGEPGTEVRLGVTRGPEHDRFDFSLTRTEIHVSTVQSAYLGDGYGYIHLSGFSDHTVDELVAAATELDAETGAQGLDGLVLDLRDNPGGVLQAAIGVADVFLEKGLIVRGSGRIREAYFESYADSGDALESVPLAVLINNRSASGSEIVAGALKDHGRATLIGQRSYGKGSVQSVVPLTTGTAMKLTTAHYRTPSGANINGRGIDPDITVDKSETSRQYRGAGSSITVAEDRELSEALQTLGFETIALSQAH
jgi:carboxyl-terminal processing protease